MTKLKAGDLKKIKERVRKESALDESGYTTELTVHMGTCGLAAGAEEVFNALKDEIEKSNRRDIRVVISGCAGMCSSEPNVTVRRMGEDAILYRDVNGEKMRQIYQEHVLKGEIQNDFALARIR